MIVVGLTGSIGMGKSTVAAQFSALGAKTASADGFVHQLLASDKQVFAEIEQNFPTAILHCHPALVAGSGETNSASSFITRPRYKNGVTAKYIDRQALGKIVFADAEKRKILERILHPRVVALEEEFGWAQRRLGAKLLVLDIPLLFETGAQNRVDYTIVVTAPEFIQRRRVLARAGMSAEKFERIIKTQMPDREKQEKADFIVQTGLGKAHSFKQVKQLINSNACFSMV